MQGFLGRNLEYWQSFEGFLVFCLVGMSTFMLVCWLINFVCERQSDKARYGVWWKKTERYSLSEMRARIKEILSKLKAHKRAGNLSCLVDVDLDEAKAELAKWDRIMDACVSSSTKIHLDP